MFFLFILSCLQSSSLVLSPSLWRLFLWLLSLLCWTTSLRSDWMLRSLSPSYVDQMPWEHKISVLDYIYIYSVFIKNTHHIYFTLVIWQNVFLLLGIWYNILNGLGKFSVLINVSGSISQLQSACAGVFRQYITFMWFFPKMTYDCKWGNRTKDIKVTSNKTFLCICEHDRVEVYSTLLSFHSRTVYPMDKLGVFSKGYFTSSIR